MAADKVAADKHRRGFPTLSFFCLWHFGLACEGVPFWGVARCGVGIWISSPPPLTARNAKARPPIERYITEGHGSRIAENYGFPLTTNDHSVQLR